MTDPVAELIKLWEKCGSPLLSSLDRLDAQRAFSKKAFAVMPAIVAMVERDAELERVRLCVSEVSAEMRDRKINHGRDQSATLVAWADRLDGAQQLDRRPLHRTLAKENERLRAELAECRKDAAIGRLVREKLTSGNSIPVERCVIRAAEVAALAQQKGNAS